MQVIHVRFPPSAGLTLTPTRREKGFTHGYFFFSVNKPETMDEIFLSAPDSGRIAILAEGIPRATLTQKGTPVSPRPRAEAVELISAPSAASK